MITINEQNQKAISAFFEFEGTDFKAFERQITDLIVSHRDEDGEPFDKLTSSNILFDLRQVCDLANELKNPNVVDVKEPAEVV